MKKNLGCWGYIGDEISYPVKYRDYDKPFYGSLLNNQNSMAHMCFNLLNLTLSPPFAVTFCILQQAHRGMGRCVWSTSDTIELSREGGDHHRNLHHQHLGDMEKGWRLHSGIN